MTSAIEKAREAARVAYQARPVSDFLNHPPSYFVNAALDAAFASLKASGHVIVPVEPTEAMLEASERVEFLGFHGNETLHRNDTRRVYAAMIAEGK